MLSKSRYIAFPPERRCRETMHKDDWLSLASHLVIHGVLSDLHLRFSKLSLDIRTSCTLHLTDFHFSHFLKHAKHRHPHASKTVNNTLKDAPAETSRSAPVRSPSCGTQRPQSPHQFAEAYG